MLPKPCVSSRFALVSRPAQSAHLFFFFYAGRAKQQMWTEPFEFFDFFSHFLGAPRCHIVSTPRPLARRLDNLPIVAPRGRKDALQVVTHSMNVHFHFRVAVGRHNP